MSRLTPTTGRPLLLALAVLGLACGAPGPPDRVRVEAPAFVSSNVTRADYAGSEACAGCHEAIASRFAASPMHRMTRRIESTEIDAPFEGGRFEFGGESVTFERRGEARFFVVDAARRGGIYRLTKVIGGRYREDFVGERVRALSADPISLADPPRELVLPVSFIRADGEWRYKGYSVQIPARDRLAVGPEWRRTCVFCHNTVPYLSTVLDDLGGYERRRYQGSIPSNLLPESRRLDYEITDAFGLAEILRAELALLGSEVDVDAISSRAAVGHAMVETGARFDGRHLVEVGIGCESCHRGSRAHAEAPHLATDYRPRSPHFTVRPARGGELGRAEAINHTCAGCHSVLMSRYPFTWEGGRRADALPGGSTINSGEARDFLLGGCATEFACTSCHDPHAEDSAASLARLGTPAGNPTCTSCHEALAAPDALSAHSGHDPAGAGGACVGCHMPQKNAGLGYGLTRYHRIGSPTDRARVEGDRPIECALCHREASVGELLTQIERLWGRRYDEAAIEALYGPDLEVNALEATFARGRPHERTVAIAAFGATGSRRHLARLVDALGDELPLNRFYAREAIGQIVGARPVLDMAAPGPALRAEAQEQLRGQ